MPSEMHLRCECCRTTVRVLKGTGQLACCGRPMRVVRRRRRAVQPVAARLGTPASRPVIQPVRRLAPTCKAGCYWVLN